jgi:hypothetical protein
MRSRAEFHREREIECRVMARRAADRPARLLHLELAGFHALAAAAETVRRDRADDRAERALVAHLIGRQIAGAAPPALD